MSELNIAICEDEESQRIYLETLVCRWKQNEGAAGRTDCYPSAEQLYYSFDGGFPYDLYILDIQMGNMSGMELARKIREYDRDAAIVFLTGLREYAIEGYEVGAARYLIKPIREEELFQIIGDIYRDKKGRKKHYFVLERPEGTERIEYRDILYVEVKGHYVYIVCNEREICHKVSFISLKPEFEKNGFVMSKRGLLVNLCHVEGISKTACQLDNGEELPISRNCYRVINEAFIKYYRNGGFSGAGGY